MKKIAVLISGSGSNLQALIDANIDIAVVISNKENAYGLERAKKHNIPAMFISKKGVTNEEYSRLLLHHLKQCHVDGIVLAGFLSILSSEFTSHFKNKIINIHPSLIPAFCGMGYYGMKVHDAVFKSGVKYTGATTHFVDEYVDHGYIIDQEIVEISSSDTPIDIANKVLEKEHVLLVKSVKAFCEDKIKIVDEKVIMEEK